MERVGLSIKNFFGKIAALFQTTESLRFYDKAKKIILKIAINIVIYAILICMCYIIVYPLLISFFDSIKSEEDLLNPDVIWLAKNVSAENYKLALKDLYFFMPIYIGANKDIYLGLKSTLISTVLYSTIQAVIATIVTGLTGYAFARFNFRFKKFWFFGLILSFIIPIQIVTIPRKLMLQNLINFFQNPGQKILGQTGIETNRLNTYVNILSTTPLLLLSALGQGINSAILIFIFYSFFKMIPVALDEAAQIDGANHRQIFYHVIIKMSVPTILVVFLFSFVWNWNDTFQLRHLTNASQNAYEYRFETLPQALDASLRRISQGEGGGDSPVSSGRTGAAIIISILPLILLYIFTQRKFVEGIENTGVTGV